MNGKKPRPDAGRPGRVSPTAPKTKSVSHAVWGLLDSVPGLSERIQRADAAIEAGEGTPFKEIRRGR